MAKLSVSMKAVLKEWEEKGYKIVSSAVRFIVAWKPKEVPKSESENAVLLADITLSKVT